MKRGEIYYADLSPVVGSEQGGYRPVIIISNDIGNKYSTTVTIACITSKLKKDLPTHVQIPDKDKIINSTVLLEQVRTIDKKRIKKFVGRVSDECMEKINNALKVSIGIKKYERSNGKMNNLVKIGNREISTKEYKGQRVVTFKDIDIVHERLEGTARKRFYDNRGRFIESVDFFKISPSEFRTTIGYMDYRQQNDITLLTESGYLMLVKSFTDDLAWTVQRQLVNSYFRTVKHMTPEEMMRVQLGMLDGHEERISKLENTMNIDYGQQRVLEREVAAVVISSLGGKDSNAYHEISKKVFAECNRDVKDYFRVNSRNNIPRLRFEDAVEYIRNWTPCSNTRMEIKESNAQMRI